MKPERKHKAPRSDGTPFFFATFSPIYPDDDLGMFCLNSVPE